MNDKNIEETAKEYNSWKKFVSDYRIWTPSLEKACKIAEKQGYNKANKAKMTFLELELDIKNQDNAALLKQLTQYKEALRELVEHHERLKYINPRGMNKHVEYGMQLYNQAKQLLNKE